MVREVVAAVRSKRGLYPERRDAEPQVMGLAPRTTKEWKPETIKTCILRNPISVEAQKCSNNKSGFGSANCANDSFPLTPTLSLREREALGSAFGCFRSRARYGRDLLRPRRRHRSPSL